MGELSMEDQIVKDLTLLLLHLTSWEERSHEDLTIHRAWKGFRFEALDALEEAGYLSQTKRAKSVTLTESGIERARELAARYLGEAAECL
jgi:DNA-binding PadR family transcriptional regulator